VPRDDGVCRMSPVRHLCHGVEERAAAVVLASKPLTEYVEHRKEPLDRILRSLLHPGLEPLEPRAVATIQPGHERVLRAEVLVKAGFGNSGIGDDAVDPNAVDAVLIEQSGCRVEDALASSTGTNEGELRSRKIISRRQNCLLVASGEQAVGRHWTLTDALRRIRAALCDPH